MSVKNSIETVLFDLDGTLINSEATAATAIVDIFRDWGIHVRMEDASLVAGRTWDITFQYLFAKYPVPVSHDEAKKIIIKKYRDVVHNHFVAIPGGAEAIINFSKHFSLGLVSGSNRTDIIWALKKLNVDQHFKIILGAEDYPRSKPAPDGYLKAMNALAVEPSACVVFEDSTPGITSARQAGAWVIAVTAANIFNHDLSLAHGQIRDFTGIDANWLNTFPFENQSPLT